MEKEFGPAYASSEDSSFMVKYRASCHCKAVQIEMCADPVDAKICHCVTCQRLHGAPMQWAAIFHKHDVRIAKGADCLKFYNSELSVNDRILPCKVRCGLCGTLIADEGRRMWLAFPSLFDFGFPQMVPEAFMPTCHIFYGSRVVDINDNLPKWSGHKNNSERMFYKPSQKKDFGLRSRRRRNLNRRHTLVFRGFKFRLQQRYGAKRLF